MLHFRKFTEEDWISFEEIAMEAFARENILKENFLQILDDEGFIGAFKDEKLVGYLRLLLLNEYGHLGQIVVEKSERGKGFGNKLMENAIIYFGKKDVENVGLYVETKNNTTISLYEKYGFEKQFESRHYWIKEEELKEIEKNYQQRENSSVRILTVDDYAKLS
ncbi:MAG: GNAT family N-acetyltransferase [Candidatus Heimdallarchaeota archaeon]|nr:GNAT family N-acetyltransferase [Candidatus Heimdallarchaeota archaeon]